MPNLQRQQGPQLMAMIAFAVEMFGDQPAHGALVEVTAPQRRLRQDVVAEKILQAAAKPLSDGDAESRFFAPNNFPRQGFFHGPLQYILRGHAFELERRRNPARILQKLMIEKRAAGLQ